MPSNVAMPVRAGALLLLCIAVASARAPMTNAQESGICTDTRCGGAAWLCCEGSPGLQDKTICSTTLDCDSCCGWVSSEPAIPRACKAPYDTYPFCDASLPLDKRVDDLISKLTLDEKPQLLVARNSPKGNISRLGIPEYDWGGNCIHGVQSRCAPDGRCPTSFPNPIGLGGTFNRSVWRQMGEVIGLELRALWLQGVGENHDSNLPHIGLDCWSPNIEIVRDPRWGRNLETPSEDPSVCGSFGVEVTKGLQESSLDPRYVQAIVTLKHFDANSLEGDWGPSGNITRHTVDAQISEYELHLDAS